MGRATNGARRRASAASLVRISLDVPGGLASLAEQAAYATGVQGLEVVDEEVGEAKGRVIVRLYLPAGAEAERAERSLREAVPGARFVVEPIETESSEALVAGAPPARPGGPSGGGIRPRPRRLGKRFLVHADGLTERAEREARTGTGGPRIPLVLDASRAFGDGFHPTTRLAVGALERLFETRRFRRVLDVGTGTGVLALVAAELGAEGVVGTDVDPLAREAAVRAVRLHGQRERIAIRARMPRETFDLVVANLYRDLLLSLAEDLAARVGPRGVLVVSGFASRSSREIAAAFEPFGLAPRRRGSREGWGVLELGRGRTPER